MSAHEPRFLADSMLGKVARWLVILGYDALYAGADGRSDAELMEQAAKEGRVFLTRDAKIPDVRGVRKLVIHSQRFEGQLRQIFKELSLRPDRARLFTRCTYCNRELIKLAREEALPQVPPMVRELETEFFQCAECRRVYWMGSHTDKTVAKLERFGLLG
jgi:uncharacterized protein with PIN domain